jgi:phytoene synthase
MTDAPAPDLRPTDPGATAAGWAFPNAATPEGSEAYYTVRFAPPDLRDRLAIAFAWRAEIAHLVDKAGDPGVARLKLDWWREELTAARRGSARHPLTRGLSDWLGEWQDPAPWQQMLEGAEMQIRKRQPRDDAEFVHHCDLLGGAFGEILACAGGTPDDRATLATARRFGRYHEAVRRLHDLPALLSRQYCPIPVTALRNVDLTPERLTEPRHRAALGTCLARTVAAVGEPAQDLRSRPLRAPRHPAAAAARLAAQAAALHRAMRRRDYAVLDEPIAVTPLRRLWSAWRLR